MPQLLYEISHINLKAIIVEISSMKVKNMIDLSLTWDQREEQWKLSGKIYKTNNFTQSAEGHKDGLWTTVLSAAVMIL